MTAPGFALKEREREDGQKQPGGAQQKRRGPKQGGSPGERCALQRKTGINGKHMWRPYVPPWRSGTSEVKWSSRFWNPIKTLCHPSHPTGFLSYHPDSRWSKTSQSIRVFLPINEVGKGEREPGNKVVSFVACLLNCVVSNLATVNVYVIVYVIGHSP